MRAAVGILAVSCHLPQHKRSVEDLFREEGANFSADVATRLGIKQVPIQNGDASETASNMAVPAGREALDRKSTRLKSSHSQISYALFCLKKKKPTISMRH